MKPTLPSIQAASVFAAIFVTFGIYLPFFPLLLAERGLQAAEIATVMAVPMVLRIVLSTPLGVVADKVGNRRAVLFGYALVSAIAFVGFGFVQGFVAILIVTAATALFWNGLVPVADTMAISIARRGEGEYGRIRLWGSVAFLAANIGAGVIVAETSSASVFWMLVGAFWLQAAVSLVAPSNGLPIALPVTGLQIAGLPSLMEPLTREPRLRDLTTNWRLLCVLAGSALIQASHALIYIFGSILWADQGFAPSTVGLYWAVGVIAEIVLFGLGARIQLHIGPIGLIVIGGVFGMLRWFLSSHADQAWHWVFIQLLHALSFAATYLGVIVYVTKVVPDRLTGAAQGLVVTVTGIMMASATLASGPLYTVFGGQGFIAMAGMSGVGAAVALLALRGFQPHKAASGG